MRTLSIRAFSLTAMLICCGVQVAIAQDSASVTPDSKSETSARPEVEVETSEGTIVIELNAEKAPDTVANFLEYVASGHYEGTVFHRVIDGFMIQCGGMDENLKEKETRPPIRNEADNGLINKKYTVAMARTNDPDSATSQFFINTADNAFLNRNEAQGSAGYAVFGRVVKGLDVVDKIGATKTYSRPNPAFPAMLMRDVPVTPIVIKSVKVRAAKNEQHADFSSDMNVFLKPLGLLYRAMRRLGVLDITRLMHLPAHRREHQAPVDGYDIRVVQSEELGELIRSNRAPSLMGSPGQLEDGRRALVVACRGDRVVSFVWFAKQTIDGAENFSRAAHLGTSIDMPDGTVFVYNAWTNPDDRGKRLIASILGYALNDRVVGAWSLLTSIDWTNEKSIRAFEFLGMEKIGTVVRFGWGRLQISLVPAAARGLGVRVAEDAPGFRFAV